MAHRKPRIDVHAEISKQIITMLETATGIFDCPWYRTGAIERPRNATTDKRHQGINVVALWASSMQHGYTSGLWATYRQWASIGARVKRDEKGTRSVFYKTLEKEGADGSDVTIPFARSKGLIAAEQVEGFEIPDAPMTNNVEAIAAVDALIGRTGAKIEHGGERAFYQSATDNIQMPDVGRFDDTGAYYSTLLHEITHWTGAVSRCDCSEIKSYAFEELVAELGAAFLCADLGITATPREDHAEYLAHWLQALKDDSKAISKASTLASKAAEYVMQFQAIEQAA